MDLKDIDKKREAEKKQILKQRGKSVNVGGNTLTEGTRIQLTTGEKVLMKRAGLGNPAKPMMHVVYDDGRKATISMTFREKGLGGAPKTDIKDTSQTKKRASNRFLNKQNIESNKVAEKIRLGKIKDKAELRNSPDYKKIQSNDIKNKLMQVLVKQGGDASYKPVEKKEVKKKFAGSFAKDKLANIKPGAIRAPGVSRDSDGVIQIQEKLLVDKKTLDSARRSMSQRAFIQKYPGQKYASGGMVNAKLGAFVEVQNNFSDRMLPNKKRTTRIY